MIVAKRRWLQFRLPTLLLLVAAVAVPCGLLKWKMLRKEREREAVGEIKKVGGYVLYEWEWVKRFYRPNEGAPGPALLRKLLGDDFFTSLVWVDLMGSQEITDEWLVRLEPLADLKQLFFSEADISDDGVRYLEKFKTLTSLSLDGTRVTDTGLAHLKALNELQWLDVSDTTVTDAGLVHLTALTKLRSLNLADTKVTDAGLRHLKGLSELRQVWIPGAGVTKAGIAGLQKALPNCEIYHCIRLP